MQLLIILCSFLAIINLALAVCHDAIVGFLQGIAFATCTAGAILLGVKLYVEPSPTALDVYNGKTTLEITYRDSVAVDSVVVWKEE